MKTTSKSAQFEASAALQHALTSTTEDTMPESSKNPCKSCVSANSKTIKSVDFDTSCPKREAGNPCKYCYVETARRQNFNAKHVYSTDYAGEIEKLTSGMIEKLNSCGGIRLFSFGDYQSKDDANLRAFFDACHERGLKVKAITKVPAFVHKYHADCAVINVSVDAIGDGVDHEEAEGLRAAYPNVRIRAVVTEDADLENLPANTDILTFNHGNNGFHNYRHAEVAEKALQFPGKVCCQTGKCLTCSVKCGL